MTCSKPKRKRRELSREETLHVITNAASAQWWDRDGRYIDPDFSEVDWYAKRGALARGAFEAGARWERARKS